MGEVKTSESEVAISIGEPIKIEFLRKTQKKEFKTSDGRVLHYFTNHLEGETPSLGTHLKGSLPVIGVVFEDGTVAWSKEPGTHSDIVASEGKEAVARFQGLLDPEEGLPNIQIVVERIEDIQPIYSFMRRSHVSPDSNLSILYGEKLKLLSNGKFGRISIPHEAPVTPLKELTKELYTPGERAIIFDPKTGKVASAWAHGQAYRKLGLRYGKDPVLHGIRMNDGSIYTGTKEIKDIREMGRALLNAGEPESTIIQYHIGPSGIRDKRGFTLRELVDPTKSSNS